MVPPGIAAEPLAPLASEVDVESKVASGLAQLAAAQTWKVTLPVSLASGSAKVADDGAAAGLGVAEREDVEVVHGRGEAEGELGGRGVADGAGAGDAVDREG